MFKINLFAKLLMRFSPKLFMRYMAKKQGLEYDKVKYATKLFRGAERIDVFPCRHGGRGFIIILDRRLSLYFYQHGDHFYCDGFEIGRYKKGDVTIFDKLSF